MKTKHYYHPTPKKWRKIGDSLLIIGTTITASAIANDADVVAYIALACTVGGKVITNLFKED